MVPLKITASELSFSPPPTNEVGAFADDLRPILLVVVEGPNTEKEKNLLDWLGPIIDPSPSNVNFWFSTS